MKTVLKNHRGDPGNRNHKSGPQHSTSKETSFVSASRKDRERGARIKVAISHFNKGRPNQASFPILPFFLNNIVKAFGSSKFYKSHSLRKDKVTCFSIINQYLVQALT